jgi:hypothetical protein
MNFRMSNIEYRIKVYSVIRYNVGLRSLQSDIGSSDIKLSPISLITDIELSAHLWLSSSMNVMFTSGKWRSNAARVAALPYTVDVPYQYFPSHFIPNSLTWDFSLVRASKIWRQDPSLLTFPSKSSACSSPACKPPKGGLLC